jgi:hypothetical protein
MIDISATGDFETYTEGNGARKSGKKEPTILFLFLQIWRKSTESVGRLDFLLLFSTVQSRLQPTVTQMVSV